MKHVRSIPLLLGVAALASPRPLLGQSDCRPVGEDAIYACVHPGPGPTIVLAAGAAQDSRTWADLVLELRRVGTVVTFDRPGLGRSPSVDRPRTPTAIARELRGVLERLGLAEPAVMVGHSMGGVHLLRFADLYPTSVAGLILVDTPPPTFEVERMSLLTDTEREAREEALAEGRARAAPIVGEERDGAAAEAWIFDPLPHGVPLIVIVGDSQFFGPWGSQQAHRTLWLELSHGWLALSTDGDLLIAQGSGHLVHVERPDIVVDAVRRVIAQGQRRQQAD